MQNDIEYLEELDNPDQDEYSRTLLDLVNANTMDFELASFLVDKVRSGSSYITGSGPGGIGKTTTMHALLPFCPKDLPFLTALPGEIQPFKQERRSVVISNELSDHPPPTYLWNNDLRDYFNLLECGHILVSNVHADNHDETFQQMVTENHVPEHQFRSINLLIFICLEGGNPDQGRIKDNVTPRIVNKVYYSDGKSPHELVYTPDNGLSQGSFRNHTTEEDSRHLLTEIMNIKLRTVSEMRKYYKG